MFSALPSNSDIARRIRHVSNVPKEPHLQLQAVRCISKAVPRHGYGRGHSPVPAAPGRDGHEYLQSQPHHDRSAVLVPRDAAAAGSCRRDLSSPRAAEDSAGDEPGRDASRAGRRLEPQGPRGTQSLLWVRPARQRGGPVEGQAYRQGAKDYSHRAVQGPQGSERDAVAQDALLRQWWKVRPTRWDTGVPLEERWLFPGRKPGKPMTTRQLSRLFHETADAAGIKKNVTLHALRHSFATHLLEDDTDIRIIQALLGHDKLDTTARYTRVATGLIAGIESPLDRLSQPRKKPKKAKGRGSKDQPTA